MHVKDESNIREPIGRVMGKISRIFLADLQNNLSHLDIKRSYYPLVLIEAGKGKLTQKELSGKLLCNKVQSVRIIDYLSSNGYVERVQNANDRRKINLQITVKAEKILPDIRKAFNTTTSMAVKGIPENQVNELYVLLLKIENNLATNKTNL
jgi:MarR family transcriptional regulator, transcriptional regulator for hemolysin